MARVVLVESYYGGSHRAWADTWIRHSRHDIDLITLPDEFWRWRLRGAAVTLAGAFDEVVASDGAPDAVVLSGMIDVATFAGLARRALDGIPLAVYVHESQLLYPLAPKQRADTTSALINWRSLLAADAVWFNSAFHRDALRAALPGLMKSQPAPSHDHLIDGVFDRAKVLWPPVEIDHLLQGERAGEAVDEVPHVLWNQRWDHDKNPRAVFGALARLADEGVPFTVSLAGQNLRPKDPDLAWAHERLGDRIDHSGFLPADDYAALLCRSDVVVSAADHEFFGIAFVEAMAAGAVPVVPDRLSFPEIVDRERYGDLLYPEGELRSRLGQVLTDLPGFRRRSAGLRDSMARFAAPVAAAAHDDAVDALLAGLAQGEGVGRVDSSDVERTADLVARSSGPADTGLIAEQVATVLEPNDVLVLGGDLGAGKTTFTKALGAGLGISEVITSPTFTLHQRYDGGRLVLHHLDVYRIDQIEEVVDLALPELFESGGVVVIEWGDTIRPALPAEYALLSFAFGEGDDERELTLSAHGASWSRRVPTLTAALGTASTAGDA